MMCSSCCFRLFSSRVSLLSLASCFVEIFGCCLDLHKICSFFIRSNCAENIRKHILHTGKHDGVKMYNCPKCSYATNAPMDFRNHLKETHPDIENPDLAYLHAGIMSVLCFSLSFLNKIKREMMQWNQTLSLLFYAEKHEIPSVSHR